MELNNAIDSPWCFIDDFNEKKGGQIPSVNKFTRLSKFLDVINAETIPVNGRLFTCKRRVHSHTHLIYERLDCSIARKDQLNIYHEAFELHGSFTCSDHCLIICQRLWSRNAGKLFLFAFKTPGLTTSNLGFLSKVLESYRTKN